MRLTLRTMLAYMDDILEPADADDIRTKMENSKFASELSQRIRDCVRMLRLPAPPLQGRGLGLDANSVAKYLDNELPAERVADFEKICLESDKHLAEVASCHQILTLVLGEPATVDPVARERMYALIDQSEVAESHPQAPPQQAPLAAPPRGDAEGADAVAAGATADFAVSRSSATTRRAKPEVPDYLREKHASRIWPVAAVMLVAFILTAGVFTMIAPPEWRDQASSWFRGEGAGSNNAENAAASGSQSDLASNGGDPSPGGLNATENGAPKSPADAGQGDRNGAGTVGTQAGTASHVPQQPTAAGAIDLASSNSGLARPAGELPIANPALPANQPPLTAPGGAIGPGTIGPGAIGSGGPLAPAVASAAQGVTPLEVASAAAASARPGEVPPRPVAMPDAVAAATPGAPLVASGAAGIPPAGAPSAGAPSAGAPAGEPVVPWRVGEEMGRYTSEQDVLLKPDATSGAWRRLPPKSAIVSGDLLLSLPAYRSEFNLVTGVNIQAVGPSEFLIKGFDPQSVPTIAIRYGRLMALTIGRMSNQIRFEFGDRSGLVTFGDTNSALAIEVERALPAGVDPESELAPLGVTIFATSGSIRWDENGHSEVIQAPAGRTLAPLPIAELAGTEIPKWVSADGLNAIEQKGAADFEKDLRPDRSISLAIKELSDNQRSEVRALATRCAGYIGLFEPAVNALGNDLERNDWSKHIESLRAALARGPETAAQVRAAFEKHRDSDAARLYRMLWGYTPEQFKDGAAQQLVEDLNNDSLDFRVLSFWNLKNITGLTLFYRPEHPEAKRRPTYLKWKERWREGKLTAMATAKAGAHTARPPADNPEQ